MQKFVPLVKQNVMKLEVFILGGQRIDRREKIEKGSKERIEKRQRGTELGHANKIHCFSGPPA